MPRNGKRHLIADVDGTQTRRLHTHLALPRGLPQRVLQQVSAALTLALVLGLMMSS